MTASAAGRVGVVLVAAGSGQRFGNADKVLVPLRGMPVIQYSLNVFSAIPDVVEIVVVAGPHSFDRVCDIVAESMVETVETRIVHGGATRTDSVRNGLTALTDGIDVVAVHDAARPLVSVDLVQRVLAAARLSGAAVPVVYLGDTIYQVEHGQITGLEERDRLRAAQTPQVARRDWLLTALSGGAQVTDEGSALFQAGFPVAIVEGAASNLKLTWPADIRRLEALLAETDVS